MKIIKIYFQKMKIPLRLYQRRNQQVKPLSHKTLLQLAPQAKQVKVIHSLLLLSVRLKCTF